MTMRAVGTDWERYRGTNKKTRRVKYALPDGSFISANCKNLKDCRNCKSYRCSCPHHSRQVFK